jgi:hypothetical protein
MFTKDLIAMCSKVQLTSAEQARLISLLSEGIKIFLRADEVKIHVGAIDEESEHESLVTGATKK